MDLAAQKLVTAALARGNPMTSSELAARTGLKMRQVTAAARDLAERGAIQKKGIAWVKQEDHRLNKLHVRAIAEIGMEITEIVAGLPGPTDSGLAGPALAEYKRMLILLNEAACQIERAHDALARWAV